MSFATDGLSNTVALSEVKQGKMESANSLYGDFRGFLHRADGCFFNTYYPPNTNQPDTMMSANYCANTDGMPCEAVGSDTDADGNVIRVSARSYHTGGVNAGLGDGSVRFFNSTINVGVWRTLGTAAGGEVTSF
jgi:prepilin-type processing-associated H-X9-DG protein